MNQGLKSKSERERGQELGCDFDSGRRPTEPNVACTPKQEDGMDGSDGGCVEENMCS